MEVLIHPTGKETNHKIQPKERQIGCIPHPLDHRVSVTQNHRQTLEKAEREESKHIGRTNTLLEGETKRNPNPKLSIFNCPKKTETNSSWRN